MSTSSQVKPVSQPLPLLTMEQLCARWGVSEDTVREHIRHDRLPFVPIGGGKKRPLYRFRIAAIERWEAAREQWIEHDDGDGDGAGTPGSVPSSPPPPSIAALWDGKSRITHGKRRKGGSGSR